jgi:hypothetical protein
MTPISDENTLTKHNASYHKLQCLTEEDYKLYDEGKRSYRKGGRTNHRE